MTLRQIKPTLACPYCGDRHIIKKGVRKNKYGTVQLFACRRCKKKFTPLVTKHKSFPLRVIIEALSQYNRLHSLDEEAAIASRKFGVRVHRQTLTNWLSDLSGYLPVLRMRRTIEQYAPRSGVFLERQLFHGQVYAFKYHRAKALLLEGHHEFVAFRPLLEYFENVPHSTPHALFREERARASTHKAKFDLEGVEITPKENAAIKNAKFVLQAVANNKLRHEVLQEFMLVSGTPGSRSLRPLSLAVGRSHVSSTRQEL